MSADPSGNSSTENLVTVVVPARNEEAFIGPCLDSILAQQGVELQVIVVDGASDDGTVEVVRERMARDSRLELLHNPQAIIPVSLNLALAAARGLWLVRVDAHSTIPPGYVRGVAAHLASGRWGGVGGRKDGVGVTPAGKAVAAAMMSRFGVGNSPYHFGSATRTVEHIPFGGYPTELVRKLGGWDERLLVNQDYEFDYRLRQAGNELLFDPSLVILWHCRQSTGDLFSQYRRYGRDKANVAVLHPRSVRLRQVAPSAMVLAWAGAALLGRRHRRLAVAVLAPYPLALAAATVVTGRELSDRRARRHLPAAFAAMHVGWGVGLLEIGGRLAFNAVAGRTSPPARPGVVEPVSLKR